MRQGDQRRQVVEGQAGDRQGFIPGQGATLVEQSAFGGGERHGNSLERISAANMARLGSDGAPAY